jgi:hypothetical protein
MLVMVDLDSNSDLIIENQGGSPASNPPTHARGQEDCSQQGGR